MVEVTVEERKARVVSVYPITSGSVGLQVCFHFSDHWRGLTRTAVFKGSGTSIDVPLLNGATVCSIPTEVLANYGGRLFIGVYGSYATSTGDDDEEETEGEESEEESEEESDTSILLTAMPTVWADAGRIEEGAIPSSTLSTADPPTWATQMQAALDAALARIDALEDDVEDLQTALMTAETAISNLQLAVTALQANNNG